MDLSLHIFCMNSDHSPAVEALGGRMPAGVLDREFAEVVIGGKEIDHSSSSAAPAEAAMAHSRELRAKSSGSGGGGSSAWAIFEVFKEQWARAPAFGFSRFSGFGTTISQPASSSDDSARASAGAAGRGGGGLKLTGGGAGAGAGVGLKDGRDMYVGAGAEADVGVGGGATVPGIHRSDQDGL